MSVKYPQSSPGPQFEIGQQLINAFQTQKQQIHKIKQQNRILTNLKQKVERKDAQIEELQKLVKKYRKYYEDYQLLKATLNQKIKQHERLIQENKILFSEMNKVLAENKQMQEKLLIAEKAKLEFVKQRNASDIRFRGIQQTFREYQQQCKNKQKQLLRDLQKAYQQIKDSSNKIEDLQTVKFQNQQLKAKITNFNSLQFQSNDPMMGQMTHQDEQQNISQNRNHNVSTFINPNSMLYHSQGSRNLINFSKSRQKSPNKSNSRVYDADANAQIERLRRELVSKQMQLQRSKSLNHELSIEFDKSVSKICEFQKELSMYRKQNHELKKTLSLFVQKQQYEKMHKNKLRNHGSEDSEEQEEEDSDTANYSRVSDSRR